MTEKSIHDDACTAGFATRPCPGERVCGDSCGIWTNNRRIVLALADGLGHGSHAASAAEKALCIIGSRVDWPLERLFGECDEQLRDTRGAALCVASIELDTGRMVHASVGNIRTVILNGDAEKRLSGACGIIGAGYDYLAPEVFTLTKLDWLTMYSDGFEEYLPLRELFEHNESNSRVTAEQALARWASGRDDASMLIYRHDA